MSCVALLGFLGKSNTIESHIKPQASILWRSFREEPPHLPLGRRTPLLALPERAERAVLAVREVLALLVRAAQVALGHRHGLDAVPEGKKSFNSCCTFGLVITSVATHRSMIGSAPSPANPHFRHCLLKPLHACFGNAGALKVDVFQGGQGFQVFHTGIANFLAAFKVKVLELGQPFQVL
jgi:hypothetical protein